MTISMTKAFTKSTSCVHQINFTYARECFRSNENGFLSLFPPRLQHFNTLNTILMFSTSRFSEKEPKSIYKYLIKRHRKSIKELTAAVYMLSTTSTYIKCKCNLVLKSFRIDSPIVILLSDIASDRAG